ncbi:MAG: ATP-binding protein [Candidatus Electrothrix sp. MAN1_4]|nr:ATP-binding protein [Candidatus Electrothrix sp. MAN1_4]
MIKQLKMNNVGPAPALQLEFGDRLNVLTGDNGLGKSFLLDIIWWSLTRKWPAEVNPRLPAGLMATPHKTGKASIEFTFTAKSKPVSYISRFDRKVQAWTGKAGRPSNPGLILYAQVDGSFAVWDPARNYWRRKRNSDVQDRPPAYVFNAREVWDGLRDEQRGLLCNGLIADWSGWQKENGTAFKHLSAVLEKLSPSVGEKIIPGELVRINLDDPRDIPTLKMPYGQSVPVLHASAGMRRILALAYLFVWTWEEHVKASSLIGEEITSQAVFLIDEIEAHLHPKWQRQIVRPLLDIVHSLTEHAEVQLVASTHSPLVMASVEPIFDHNKDAWFDLDLDLVGKDNRQIPGVTVSRRPLIRRGDASNWLTSDAFDLSSARSMEAEQVLERAAIALSEPSFDAFQAKQLNLELKKVLGDTDPFWMRWRFVAEKRGWF